MIDGPFALALTAGMLATVNPCGFALLPAYLSAFVGLDDGRARAGAVARALAVSAVLTAGFVTVFGLFGLVISPLSLQIEEYLPWATIVIGVVLAGLGVAFLLGKELTLSIPKLQRGGADGTLTGMYLFGVSYAVASLSCTVATFLAVTTSTFKTESYLSGIVVFVLYGVGMGIVVAVLTVAVALAKDGVVSRFRSLLPIMNRVAGGLLVVAGAYVAYYGWYEVRLLDDPGSDGDDPVVDAGMRVRDWLVARLPESTGEVWRYVVGAAVFVALALAWALRRKPPAAPRRPSGDAPPIPGPAPDAAPHASPDAGVTTGVTAGVTPGVTTGVTAGVSSGMAPRTPTPAR